MDIIKCDICRKQKKEKAGSLNEKSKWISLSIHGMGNWLSFDLCGKCSENLLKYIKRYFGITSPRLVGLGPKKSKKK